jgi:hypothetical protein
VRRPSGPLSGAVMTPLGPDQVKVLLLSLTYQAYPGLAAIRPRHGRHCWSSGRGGRPNKVPSPPILDFARVVPNPSAFDGARANAGNFRRGAPGAPTSSRPAEVFDAPSRSLSGSWRLSYSVDDVGRHDTLSLRGTKDLRGTSA